MLFQDVFVMCLSVCHSVISLTYAIIFSIYDCLTPFTLKVVCTAGARWQAGSEWQGKQGFSTIESDPGQITTTNTALTEALQLWQIIHSQQ